MRWNSSAPDWAAYRSALSQGAGAAVAGAGTPNTPAIPSAATLAANGLAGVMKVLPEVEPRERGPEKRGHGVAGCGSPAAATALPRRAGVDLRGTAHDIA